MAATIYSGGNKGAVPWESNETWPWPNLIFNVHAGTAAESRLSSAGQAPNQRAAGYPKTAANFQQRGVPQLTWFRGIYDQWAHDSRGNLVKCKYPNLVSDMSGGKRKCLEPGKATAEEIAAAQRAQKVREDAVANALSAKQAQGDKGACTQIFCTDPGAPKPTFSGATRDAKGRWCYKGTRIFKGGVEHVAYSTVASGGVVKYYDCKTNQFLLENRAYAVRGLGSTEAPLTKAEESAESARKSLYSTTEWTLMAGMLAAAFLIWRK